MKIETALADSAWARERTRDLPAQNNPTPIAKVKEMYPNIPWNRFFIETMGIATPDTVIVTQFEPLAQANNLFASLTDRELKDYYLWQYVRQASGRLSQKFVDTSLSLPRW